MFSHPQHVRQRDKLDNISQEDFTIQSYKERTVRISLPKSYSINIVSIQNTSSHSYYRHLKSTIRTERREEKFKSRAMVGRDKNTNTSLKCTIFTSRSTHGEKTETKTILFGILALPKSVTKETELDNHHFTAVSVLRRFVDNLELKVAQRTYLKNHFITIRYSEQLFSQVLWRKLHYLTVFSFLYA